MPNKKQTSPRVAKLASKGLKSKATGKNQKAVDGSALAQAKGKGKAKGSKK